MFTDHFGINIPHLYRFKCIKQRRKPECDAKWLFGGASATPRVRASAGVWVWLPKECQSAKKREAAGGERKKRTMGAVSAASAKKSEQLKPFGFC